MNEQELTSEQWRAIINAAASLKLAARLANDSSIAKMYASESIALVELFPDAAWLSHHVPECREILAKE